MKYLFLFTAFPLLIGCSAIRPETAGVMSYELGYATGKELAGANSEIVSVASDSLEAALIEAVANGFQRGLSDGLGSH